MGLITLTRAGLSLGLSKSFTRQLLSSTLHALFSLLSYCPPTLICYRHVPFFIPALTSFTPPISPVWGPQVFLSAVSTSSLLFSVTSTLISVLPSSLPLPQLCSILLHDVLTSSPWEVHPPSLCGGVVHTWHFVHAWCFSDGAGLRRCFPCFACIYVLQRYFTLTRLQTRCGLRELSTRVGKRGLFLPSHIIRGTLIYTLHV